jgi:hypothetical protein
VLYLGVGPWSWAGGPGLLVNTIVVATQAQNKAKLAKKEVNLR